MQNNPFTIRDATVTLYTMDALGNAGPRVYLGPAEVERLSCDLSYEGKKEEFTGDPDWVQRHVSREYTVEMTNIWQHQVRADGSARMPEGATMNQGYCLVVVWYDPELQIWAKRTYWKARSMGQKLEDTMETVRFSAPRMTELEATGRTDNTPSPISDPDGHVMYVSESETVGLYSFLDDGFTAEDETAGRATITPGAGAVEIAFAGTVKLRATPTGVTVGSLTALGGTFVDTLPRLDFYMGPTRIASLGATGELAVANLTEGGDTLVPSGMRLVETGGGWCGTLANPSTIVPAILEV